MKTSIRRRIFLVEQKENKLSKHCLSLTSSRQQEMKKTMKSNTRAEIQYTRTETPLRNCMCFALVVLSITVRKQKPLTKRAMPSWIFKATTFPSALLQKEQKEEPSEDADFHQWLFLSQKYNWICWEEGISSATVKTRNRAYPRLSLAWGCGWGLLETVMEASAPESDLKRMLSTTARERDGEW